MEATLEYLVDDPKWDKEKPYKIFFKTDSAIPQSNCRFGTGKAIVQDVRQLARRHSFEIDGFELIRSPIQALHAADFEDPQKEESVVVPYLQATMEFVKSRLSAERIVCIDWRVRAFSSSPLVAELTQTGSSELKAETKRTSTASTTSPMCATKLCSPRDTPTLVSDHIQADV